MILISVLYITTYLTTQYERVMSVDIDDFFWILNEIWGSMDVQTIPGAILKRERGNMDKYGLWRLITSLKKVWKFVQSRIETANLQCTNPLKESYYKEQELEKEKKIEKECFGEGRKLLALMPFRKLNENGGKTFFLCLSLP